MADLHVNGIRLYYEEHGDGRPILGIHGTGSSALMWGEAASELSRLGRVITFDRRGCTRSGRPEPYPATSVAEHGDDAVALLEAIGGTPATVIGRSYGGGVAIDMAIRYPDHVRALVLLEAGILGLSLEADRWARDVTERVRAAAARDMGTLDETLIRAVLGDAAWESMPEQVKRMFTDNGPAIFAECNGGDLTVDPAILSTLKQPTLVVGATDSPAAFRDIAEGIAAAIPNSRKALVEGGHAIDPSNAEVIRFLEEIHVPAD